MTNTNPTSSAAVKEFVLEDGEVTIQTEDGPIIIGSNGSKWNGQEPDGIETLIEVLGKHNLDLQRFAAFGFISFEESGDRVRCFGNFMDVSHVFNISGPASQLRILTDAIKKNIDRQFTEAK